MTNGEIVALPRTQIDPAASFIQLMYVPETVATGKRKHPMSEYFPPSGEFDSNMSDVERDSSGRIPDTTGVYTHFGKNLTARYNKNPNHPDFKRDPDWKTKELQVDVQPQFEFEKQIFDHECPNCRPDLIFTEHELMYAKSIPKTKANPDGCYGMQTTNIQTFETRIDDNRSTSIVCETEGKYLNNSGSLIFGKTHK